METIPEGSVSSPALSGPSALSQGPLGNQDRSHLLGPEHRQKDGP